MPRAKTAAQWTEPTFEERRERRRLRREKQREDNVKRATKMHAARLKSETNTAKPVAGHEQAVFVGCSGWRYWKWRDSFYEGVPQNDWFAHYLKNFDTVEINASFYSWPTVAGVQAWRRQPGKKKFVYTVKVSEHITHIKKFKGTKTLVKDFGMIADILSDRMGCFLFQLPPSYRFTRTRLNDIVSQLDPARRNVVEFRQPAGGMKRFTAPSGRQGSSSVPAAARAYQMSSSGQRMRFTSACTVPSAGIGTTTRRPNSRYGCSGSGPAGRNAPGCISTMTMTPMPPRTR
jgi:Protein of unknown function DUF72